MKKTILILFLCISIGLNAQPFAINQQLVSGGIEYIGTIDKPIYFSAIGQSNMVGGIARAETFYELFPEYFIEYDSVYEFLLNPNHPFLPIEPHQWRKLNPGYTHNSFAYGIYAYWTPIGPANWLAIELNKYYDVPVHFTHFAQGATSLHIDESNPDWNAQSTDEYLDWYINRDSIARHMMDSVYGENNWIDIGEIWNQGESDRQSQYSSIYQDNEKLFVDSLRSKKGYTNPFLSSGIKTGGKLTPLGYAEIINNAKKLNSREIEQYYYSSNENLIFDTDIIHYNEQGILRHAYYYLYVFKKLYRKK